MPLKHISPKMIFSNRDQIEDIGKLNFKTGNNIEKSINVLKCIFREYLRVFGNILLFSDKLLKIERKFHELIGFS